MKRGSLSLHVYFGSAMWLVSIVIVWAAAGLFLWWTGVRTEAQVRSMARAIAATLSDTVGTEWSRIDHVEVPVHLAARQHGVAFVKVRLPEGALRISAGDPGVDPELVWVEEAPVTHYNERLGTIEVAVFRSVGAQLYRPWVWATIGISIGAMFLATAASLVVTAHTTRPLQRLRDLAVHWEEPLRFELADFGGPRELEELAIGMLRMRQRALTKRAELEQEVAEQTEELAQAYAALERSFQETAASLAKALDARDRLTASHGNRTAQLAGRLAAALGLSDEEQRRLVLAANLHDVGKIGVPEAVLLKPGPLTREEWHLMQQHPAIGAAILGEVSGMADVAKVVRHHHERWDGKGYPDGLAGEEIPFFSRILAVADSVESMCARRHYRDPMPCDAVLAEIQRCSGTQFDAEIVRKAWPTIVETVEAWSAGRASSGG